MIPAKWLLAAVLSAGVLATGPRLACQSDDRQPQDVDEERYQFRVSVDLISLNVTVTDTRERFVTDLTRDDFRVVEDGVNQELSVFSQEDLALRMVLLLDSSASMVENMAFAQQAPIRFV